MDFLKWCFVYALLLGAFYFTMKIFLSFYCGKIIEDIVNNMSRNRRLSKEYCSSDDHTARPSIRHFEMTGAMRFAYSAGYFFHVPEFIMSAVSSALEKDFHTFELSTQMMDLHDVEYKDHDMILELINDAIKKH